MIILSDVKDVSKKQLLDFVDALHVFFVKREFHLNGILIVEESLQLRKVR